MKLKLFLLSAFSLLTIYSCNDKSSLKTETFKVWGNCEKCKKTIESSCTIDGVSESNWDVDSKLITVKFDTTKTSLSAIQQLIAKSGYDNDKFFGDDYAYDKLEDCCQYERKPFE